MAVLREYAELEDKFDVSKVPSISKLVNFNSNSTTPIHRWYYFKEGFSHKLVDQVTDEFFHANGTNEILDPFCGSATTLVTAQSRGIKSTGLEINPFLAFVSQTKTNNHVDVNQFNYDYKTVLARGKKLVTKKLETPALTTFKKVFTKTNLRKVLALNKAIEKTTNQKNKNLLKLALASIVEDSSKIRRSGKGLRIVEKQRQDPFDLFLEKCQPMAEDLEAGKNRVDAKVKNQDARDVANVFGSKVNLVLFSPPYLNSFDYTEVYKLELWLLGFVKDYTQFGALSKQTLRSHLSSQYKTNGFEHALIEEIKTKIAKQSLWNSNIPKMIKAYFSDMNEVFAGLERILQPKTTVAFVVGNSSYGGIPIATDLLLSDLAEKRGFSVEEIRIARKLTTSPQQLKDYSKQKKKYLRESMVILKRGS